VEGRAVPAGADVGARGGGRHALPTAWGCAEHVDAVHAPVGFRGPPRGERSARGPGAAREAERERRVAGLRGRAG